MKLTWKTCLRAGVTVFAVFLCIHYWATLSGLLSLAVGAARPLVLGCVLAFVLNIPMGAFERLYFPGSDRPAVVRSRRPVCLCLSLLSVAVILAVVLRLIVPELIACVSLLIPACQGLLSQARELLSQVTWLPADLVESLRSLMSWPQLMAQMQDFALSELSNVANLATALVSAVFSGAANAVLSLILAIYILLGKERLGRQFKALGRRYVKREWVNGLRHVLGVLHDCFHAYIVGQCTEAVILGCLCGAGMLLFRFPYAAAVGATVGVTALIPVAGAYIGGAVGFLLIFTVSPLQALLFILYLLILQQLEGNIIYPKVVGTSMGLPGIWVLCAVIVGGGVWGIPGMALGVPLAASAYRLVKEDVARGKRPHTPILPTD